MPSLKAEGSLRPDTLWKLRSPPLVVVSTVDLEMPENRLRKAEGIRLFFDTSCDIGGARSVGSSLPSWRAPFRFRLWRRSSMRTMASISAAPARLPTTLPTTCGGARGGALSVELALTAADVCAAGAAGLPCPPPTPLPPFGEGNAEFEDAVELPITD